MKRIFACAPLLVVVSALFVGCSNKDKIEKSETVTTPGGETTVTETKEVEKSGDHK